MRLALVLIIISLVPVAGCVQQEVLDSTTIETSDAGLTLSERLSSGDTSAIPEAIELLDSDKLVTEFEPPKLEREFVFYDLNKYTGLDFGYDPHSPDRDNSIQQWRNWWNENQNNIVWNGNKYVIQ